MAKKSQKRSSRKIEIDKDFLFQKYVVENLTSRQIADIVGCSKPTVLENLKSYQIPINKKIRNKRELPDDGITKELLIQKYITENMSADEAAIAYNEYVIKNNIDKPLNTINNQYV